MIAATDLIAAKRDGREHAAAEIAWLVDGVTTGDLPDYQVAAWLMAVCLRGMTPAETTHLTLSMRDSGNLVDLTGITGPTLDKHSTGGVGDKTSLVVVPMMAAAGVNILKMSGRGLGFSGGTIDKLESIDGFCAGLTLVEARSQVERIGAAIVAQTPGLVPADGRLYALRDVTATIDSIPLIASSIMSKKLACGADTVLIDVKVGSGSFMKDLGRARELAATLVRIGCEAGNSTVALLTDMSEPLGYAVGNSLEVREAVCTLTGRGRVDTRFRELCVEMCALGLSRTRKVASIEAGRETAMRLIDDGSAARKFGDILAAQGGDPGILDMPYLLPSAPSVIAVEADLGGVVTAIDGEAVGRLVVEMGGGRHRKDSAIDPAVGIVLLKKTGDTAQPGEPLAEMHLRGSASADELAALLRGAYTLGDTAAPAQPMILGVVD